MPLKKLRKIHYFGQTYLEAKLWWTLYSNKCVVIDCWMLFAWNIEVCSEVHKSLNFILVTATIDILVFAFHVAEKLFRQDPLG